MNEIIKGKTTVNPSAGNFTKQNFLVTENPRVIRIREEIYRDWLSPEEVAEILKIDKTTVYRYLKKGELAGLRLAREWKVDVKDLKGFIERLKVKNVIKRLSKEEPEINWRIGSCFICGKVIPLKKGKEDKTVCSGECLAEYRKRVENSCAPEEYKGMYLEGIDVAQVY